MLLSVFNLNTIISGIISLVLVVLVVIGNVCLGYAANKTHGWDRFAIPSCSGIAVAGFFIFWMQEEPDMLQNLVNSSIVIISGIIILVLVVLVVIDNAYLGFAKNRSCQIHFWYACNPACGETHHRFF